MAKVAGDSIFSAIEMWRGRQRPMVTFDDDKDEVIHPPQILHIRSPHWWGWYLNMAPAVSCIVVHPDGHSELCPGGGLKPFTPGTYQLTYVSMRSHNITLPDIEANSKDAWRVRLTLELVWQVKDPWRVWKLANPARVLYDQCVAAVVNYIQSSLYKDLIATPEDHPKDENQIAIEILERLNNKRALDGFRFVTLSVLGRNGDPERTKIIKKAMNQQEETKRAEEIARAKLAQAAAEQSLILQATIAQKKAEEVVAEYNARIHKLTYPVREQLLQLEQLSKSQDLNQERIIKAWEITGATMSQIANILGQIQMTPGLQHGLDNQAIETLMQFMQTLASSFPILSSLPTTPNNERKILPAVSLDHLGD